MNYIYTEKTFKIAGYGSVPYIYKLIIHLLEIALPHADKSGGISPNILDIIKTSEKDFDSFYTIINETQIINRDSNGNPILIKRGGKEVIETDTFTFSGIAAKNLLEQLYKRVLPSFIKFLNISTEKGYIKESQKSKIIRKIGQMDQIVKSNNENIDIAEKLNVNDIDENIFDREKLRDKATATEAVKLVSDLFNLKSVHKMDPVKKLYNETFRLFHKLTEFVLQVEKFENNLEKKSNETIKTISFSDDDNNRLAKDETILKEFEDFKRKKLIYSDELQEKEQQRIIAERQLQLDKIESKEKKKQFKKDIKKEIDVAKEKIREDIDKEIKEEEDKLFLQIPKEIIPRKVSHINRNHNYDLPDFAKTFLVDPDSGKRAAAKDVDARKKDLDILGQKMGVDLSGLKEQRHFFGYTKVFNSIMKFLIRDKGGGSLKAISSHEKINLESYFAFRKPYNYAGQDYWFNPEDYYNTDFYYFRIPEAFLLTEICKGREKLIGKRMAYQTSMLYDDFIYLLRLFLNKNVKERGSLEPIDFQGLFKDEISQIEKEIAEIKKRDPRGINKEKVSRVEFNQSDIDKIAKLVKAYFKELNKDVRAATSAVEKVTKKEAALKRSEEIKKQKEKGERELSKKDVADYERGISDLKDELDSLSSAESDMLYDILSVDKIDQDPDLYNKELDDLIDFAQNNTRIIQLTKNKNLLSPKISPKPASDSEIKKVMSRILNKDTSEITPEDIDIAKKIFSQDSNSFFNRKSFLIDYIDLLKGLEIRTKANPQTIHVTEPVDIPKNINNKKALDDFLKKIIKKSSSFTEEEYEASRNALKTIDDNTVDKTFFKSVYYILLKQKKAELELDRIEKLKKTEGKEIPISDIMSPLSNDKYSNRIYLQMTDLSQEIKFSYKVTGIKLNLKPKNEDDKTSDGEYIIYVSRKDFDEFVKLNEYLLDPKNKNPHLAKEIVLENENLNVSDNIPVLRGYYTSRFEAANLLDPEGLPYDLPTAYARSSSTKQSILKSKDSERKLLEIISKTQNRQIEIRKELISRARKRSAIIQKRSDYLSGIKQKEKITNKFLEKSKELLSTFDSMSEKLSIDINTSSIKSAIIDYDKLINMDDKITGSKEIKKSAEKIRKMFFDMYDSISDTRKKILAEELTMIKNVLINKKINFLKYVFEKPNPPKIVFDPTKYEGGYEFSYKDLSEKFNDSISRYIKFKFTEQDPNKKQNINLIRIKEINEKNNLFMIVIDSVTQILNLVSTPEIEEQYSRDSTRGMRLDKGNQMESKSVVPLKVAVLIQEEGDIYKKVEILKPTKFNILKEVIKRNEIK